MNLITRICCFIIGWNPKLLKECGEASYKMLKRYIAAIIIMSIIWGIIGYFFADKYIRMESSIGKTTVAFVFVTIIISIERFIILAVGRSRPTAIFRSLLAILMALLGATVFDQIIFRQDVEMQMKEVRTEQINREIPRRTTIIDEETKRISQLTDSLQQVVNELNREIAKNPFITTYNVKTTTENTGQVDSIGNQITRQIKVADRVNVPNPLIAQRDINIEALQKNQEHLLNIQQRKLNVADEVRKELENMPTGFLEELKALFSILTGNIIAFIFWSVLFLFLLFLELLVITAKMGGQQCDYDLLVEHQLKCKKETVNNLTR